MIKFSDIIDTLGAGIYNEGVEYFSEAVKQSSISKISFDELNRIESVKINLKGFKNCFLFCSSELLSKLKNNSVNLQILRMGQIEVVRDLNFVIYNFTGKIQILVGSPGSIFIGNVGSVNLDIRLGHNGKFVFGDDSTANNVRFICVNCKIEVQRDCMFSDEVLVQGFDQHGIIDLEELRIINENKKHVRFNSHVWVGRRSTVLPNVTVESGSIIGACAVVTKSVPKFTAVAGNPAKIVKEQISWSRSWSSFDEQLFDSL